MAIEGAKSWPDKRALSAATAFRCAFLFFFQAEDGIRDLYVTGVQTCALPIFPSGWDRPNDRILEPDLFRRHGASGRCSDIHSLLLASISSRRGASADPNCLAFSYQLRAIAIFGAKP